MNLDNDIIIEALYEQYCDSAKQFYENVISAVEFQKEYFSLSENVGLYILAKFELLRRKGHEVLS